MSVFKIRPTPEQITLMFQQTLKDRGYIVIGTKPGVKPYEKGQPVWELFGYWQDDDYKVDQMTDAAEYLEQMRYFAEIRPSFPFDLSKVKLEGTEHFYRVVRERGSQGGSHTK